MPDSLKILLFCFSWPEAPIEIPADKITITAGSE